MTRTNQAQERRGELALVPRPRGEYPPVAGNNWTEPAPKRPLRQRPGYLARIARLVTGH